VQATPLPAYNKHLSRGSNLGEIQPSYLHLFFRYFLLLENQTAGFLKFCPATTQIRLLYKQNPDIAFFQISDYLRWALLGSKELNEANLFLTG